MPGVEVTLEQEGGRMRTCVTDTAHMVSRVYSRVSVGSRRVTVHTALACGNAIHVIDCGWAAVTLLYVLLRLGGS